MKVLYVVGSCLTKNTSANMSHNGYVQGLLENGAQVDIIMADESWGEAEPVFSKWEQANYYIYPSESFKDRLRKKARQNFSEVVVAPDNKSSENSNIVKSRKTNIRSIVKKMFYVLFPNDSIYPLEEKWLRTASVFKNDK